MVDYVRETLYGLCKAVDTPKSLGSWLRYTYSKSEYASDSLDPKAYNDAAAFAKDYACVNAFRKYEGLDTGINTREVALQAFDKAEQQCAMSNERLRTYSSTGRIDQVELDILIRVQKLIEKVWQSPSFDTVFRHCGWGPGASATLKGAKASTEDKMSELPMSVTPSALPFLRQVMKDDLLWNGHLLRCQVDGPVCLIPQCYAPIEYSRLLTVPKDAKTDRTIAAEPTGNMFLQKAVGSYLRGRLRRYGVDLDDQSRNQRLAAMAQTLNLATLDMSMASDSVSIELCKVLLPLDMFSVLDALRTPAFKVGTSITRFHKFSSMGNGFTFELESLIFWAVCKAVQEHENIHDPIGVYGDDLIVPQSISQKVIIVLESFGFTINKGKSFVDGRFFESCGKHYFDGVDVTPFYQKHVIDNDLEISRLFNRVFDLAFKRPYLDNERCFGKVHSRLFYKLPERLKKFQAPGYCEGDGFFRVLNFNGRFCLNRGYLVHYMAATKPGKKLAGGGLYAYAIRKGDRRTEADLTLPQPLERRIGDLSKADFSSLGFTSKQLIRSVLVDFSGHTVIVIASESGYVAIRPFGRIKTYRRAKRWVSVRHG